MPEISHRDATRLHEFVLDLVHENENPDGTWNTDAVRSIIDRLDVIREQLAEAIE